MPGVAGSRRVWEYGDACLSAAGDGPRHGHPIRALVVDGLAPRASIGVVYGATVNHAQPLGKPHPQIGVASRADTEVPLDGAQVGMDVQVVSILTSYYVECPRLDGDGPPRPRAPLFRALPLQRLGDP